MMQGFDNVSIAVLCVGLVYVGYLIVTLIKDEDAE